MMPGVRLRKPEGMGEVMPRSYGRPRAPVLEECDTPMARGVLTTPTTGFRLDRTPPAPDLTGLVHLHWHVRWDLPPGVRHVQGVLPFPCVNLGHGSDGPFVAGPVSARDDRTLQGRGHALGTRIAAGLFPTIAALPAHALT